SVCVSSFVPCGNCIYAMGFYGGTLALGYSTGNFFCGLLADHLGYGPTFKAAALLSLVPVALLWFLHRPSAQKSRRANETLKAKLTLKDSFRALLEPELATVVVVALFLNLLHQMSGVFISLYGLALGMSLTHIRVH